MLMQQGNMGWLTDKGGNAMITRRDFLKGAVITSTACLVGPIVSFGSDNSGYDIVIRNGTVYNGTLARPRIADIGIRGDRISVRWTGAAGLEFTYEGKTWLIDPYLSRVGKTTMFFGRPQADREKISRYLETLPGKLQAVIVGHTHFDHALDVPEILSRFPVPLVGSESLETLMSLHGMPGKVAVCSERTHFDLPGGASVTMIPSLHGLVFFGRAPYTGEIEPGQRMPLKPSMW
jgi:glyoxylase-like metal-dependent hydrolase (beta-lactamase superfamily II)